MSVARGFGIKQNESRLVRSLDLQYNLYLSDEDLSLKMIIHGWHNTFIHVLTTLSSNKVQSELHDISNKLTKELVNV